MKKLLLSICILTVLSSMFVSCGMEETMDQMETTASEIMSDMGGNNGTVTDGDGVIGNENTENSTKNTEKSTEKSTVKSTEKSTEKATDNNKNRTNTNSTTMRDSVM